MSTLPEEIVTTSEQLTVCCQHIAECSTIGFDTEFVGEDTYYPRICLVQIATAEKLIIIDPLSCGSLEALWQLILEPERTVIVHAGREEVRLCQLWTGTIPSNIFDLQIAAGLVGMGYPLGHGALVQQMLKVKLPKGETLTEWRDRPLTDAQIRYAFDDVRFLIPLWQGLHERLEKLDRLSWAKEEFTRLTEISVTPAGAEEKYRKLKGVGSLDRKRLALVRALHRWREDKAVELNRPARTIVRDDLLIEIAKRNPNRERDLQVIRGLARRHLSDIMDTIKAARALPASELPTRVQRDIDPVGIVHMTQILAAALSSWCAKNQVTQSLVAGSRDLKQLVRARHTKAELSEKSPFASGWRTEHLLPYLDAILQGQASIRISDVTSESPFVIE